MGRKKLMRRRGSTRSRVLAGFTAAQVLWACVGSIGDGTGDDPNDPNGPSETASQAIGSTTRFARMTHEQYDRTVRVLLEQDDTQPVYSTEFRADAGDGNYLYDNASVVLGVDQGLHRSYERAAAQIALDFVNDAALYDKWVPPEGTDEERVRAFIRDFGEQVHRRPLTADQADDYYALFELGSTTYDDHQGVQGAVRLITEALFASPFFLYRTELSDEPKEGIVPLDGWEIASRLSFTIWNQMPDDSLFEAARDGLLETPEGLRTQVDRMLKDERAVAVFTKVLSQAMGIYRYDNIAPNENAHPDAPASLSGLAIEELGLIMQDLYENDGTYRSLLTEPRTFVNQDTAPLYGLSGDYTEDFEPVSLPASERRGLLTTIGFLASNSSSVNPDPIHRGVFIAQKLLCSTIQAPPMDIPPLPTPEPDQTNREAIETLTEQPGTDCATCHSTLINPFGFPFENFDAVGKIREDDRGNALDLRTSPQIDGDTVEVNDSLELIDALAERDIVYQCFGQHIASYLMGRPYEKEDADLRKSIGDGAFDDESVVDLIAGAVTSPQFTYRRLEEDQ